MLRRCLRLVRSSVPFLALVAAALLGFAMGGRTSPRPNEHPQANMRVDPSSVMPTAFPRLLLTWLALLLLGGIEFEASSLNIDRSLRPLVMLPAVLMVAAVAVSFMEVGKGPTIVRGFAVAAIFWLIVLLALGSMDPLTRIDYPVK